MEDTRKSMVVLLVLLLVLLLRRKAEGFWGLEALVVRGTPGVRRTRTPLCTAVTVKAVGDMVASTVTV